MQTEAQRLGWSETKPEQGPCVETSQGFMVPYTVKIPGSEVRFDMVPIPGGKIRIGSPAEEKGRSDNEGPQFDVEVAPMWMGKHEVTWAEYHRFMNLYDAFKELESLRNLSQSSVQPKNETPDERNRVARRTKLLEFLKSHDALRQRVETAVNDVDAVTAPTHLYEPTETYQFGDQPRQPAITMTQFAAKHYTKWLSRTTGQYYRLPTEAEWEYACRAGTNTAYSFGDDPDQLGDYAWYADNSDGELHEVGTKRPNAWGLYDMHGSVSEWVLDGLAADGHAKFAGKSLPAADAVQWPVNQFPRVIKGGHWNASAEECRSASRFGSEEKWKISDPNIPLSPWWFTDQPAHGVGFRLLRSLHTASPEELERVWEADVEDIRFDVNARLLSEQGIKEGVDQNLPAVLEQLQQLKAAP